MNLQYFLLAGGYGTRAKPLSDHRAKPAFPLLGVPLLTRMVGQILDKTAAGCKGWLNVHHLPESVTACLRPDWPLTILHETRLSGTAILRQALRDEAWSHLLVVNGDVYCDIPLAEMIAGCRGRDGVLLVREFRDEAQYRTLQCRSGRFCRRGDTAGNGLMYTGLCLLNRATVARTVSMNFFDDFESRPVDLGLCPYSGLWLDFGDPRSYFDANIAYMRHFERSPRELWAPSARLEAGAFEPRQTILWPDSLIGPGLQLENCIVCDGLRPEPGEYRDGILTRSGFVRF